MAILVTGGVGYIASHTIITLLEKGEEVIILDNLSNSFYESLHKVKKLPGMIVDFIEVIYLTKSSYAKYSKKTLFLT